MGDFPWTQVFFFKSQVFVSEPEQRRDCIHSLGFPFRTFRAAERGDRGTRERLFLGGGRELSQALRQGLNRGEGCLSIWTRASKAAVQVQVSVSTPVQISESGIDISPTI